MNYSSNFTAGSLFFIEEHGSRHRLGSEHGWALEVNLLELLKGEGIKLIRVTDAETSLVYEAELSTLLHKGVPVAFSEFGGVQPVLPLPEFATHIWVPLHALKNVTQHTA